MKPTEFKSVQPVHSGRKSDKTATQRSLIKGRLIVVHQNQLFICKISWGIDCRWLHSPQKSLQRPFCPDSPHFFVLSWNKFCYKLECWMRSNKIRFSCVKKSGDSIEIILIRRKNHYEPVLPQISTNIRFFFFNIALWFERRLCAVNQKEVFLCKKVQEID